MSMTRHFLILVATVLLSDSALAESPEGTVQVSGDGAIEVTPKDLETPKTKHRTKEQASAKALLDAQEKCRVRGGTAPESLLDPNQAQGKIQRKFQCELSDGKGVCSANVSVPCKLGDKPVRKASLRTDKPFEGEALSPAGLPVQHGGIAAQAGQ
jgi:hypothetical protein